MLEIGTGWGGFAVHAAEHAGLPRDDDDDLRASSTSTLVARVAAAGLEDLVTVLLRGLPRPARAVYDKLVSIEMIEAVGWRDFGTFFERCSDLLSAARARCCCRRS